MMITSLVATGTEEVVVTVAGGVGVSMGDGVSIMVNFSQSF